MSGGIQRSNLIVSDSSIRKRKKRKVPDSGVDLQQGGRKRSRTSQGSSSKATSNTTTQSHRSDFMSRNNSTASATNTNTVLSSGRESLTDNDTQTVKYLTEQISHNIRTSATTIVVDSFRISLWYADRFGLLVSKAFDFLERPELLVLTVAAICATKATEFGLCSLVKVPTESFTSYKGVTLELEQPVVPIEVVGRPNFDLPIIARSGSSTDLQDASSSSSEAKDESDSVDAKDGMTLDTAFVFNISHGENWHPFSAYGITGRGTTIVPLKVVHDSVKIFKDENSGLVAKLSWQHKSRLEEAEFLRVIHYRLRNDAQHGVYIKHIPKIHCSISREREYMDLPRAKFATAHELAADDYRILHVLVTNRYLRLQQIRSVQEFTNIFRQVVRGAYIPYDYKAIVSTDHTTVSASLGLGSCRRSASRYKHCEHYVLPGYKFETSTRRVVRLGPCSIQDRFGNDRGRR